MTRYDRRAQALAVGLSALAGFVDALGFLHLGGFFVSFMSGNSTRMGVGLVERTQDAAIAALLIGVFVIGVFAGSLAGRQSTHHRRSIVLGLVASALALAATCAALGFGGAAVGLMVIAMGAENAVFERDGEVHIGLTYMTGTLVKIGQRFADAATGGLRYAWKPYLMLWLGLVVGGASGAATYAVLGLGGLWIAAGFAAILAVLAGPAQTA